MRTILSILTIAFLPLLGYAEDTIRQPYIIVDSAFAVENKGYQAGVEVLNYAITNDGRYVIPVGALEAFPELFANREFPIVDLSDYDFIKP